jgi:hypothetical protein
MPPLYRYSWTEVPSTFESAVQLMVFDTPAINVADDIGLVKTIDERESNFVMPKEYVPEPPAVYALIIIKQVPLFAHSHGHHSTPEEFVEFDAE